MENYNRSLLAGVITGFLSLIPMILIYVFFDQLLPMFSLLVVLGFLLGYKACGGKKSILAIIITFILSLLIIYFMYLVVVPIINTYRLNINISNIYRDIDYINSVKYMMFMSTIFTLIGTVLSFVIISFNKDSVIYYKDEIKSKFVNKNAVSRRYALPIEELGLNDKLYNTFDELKKQLIIRKYRKKYYYDIYFDDNKFVKILKMIFIIVGLFVFFAFLVLTVVDLCF